MTSAFSWQNSISLCPASFHTQGQICLLLQVFLDFLLLYSSPLWWKEHLFWVLVLESLIGLHRTIQLQLLQHYWLGHRLGLLWYWKICLGNEQRSFCRFWDCIQVLHFRLLLTMMATPFLLRDSCPQKCQVRSFFSSFSASNLGEGNGNALQYSCLENSMDRGAWWAMVPGVRPNWVTNMAPSNSCLALQRLKG